MKKLWNDENGAILSAELIIIMTILGIGMIVGLNAIKVAVTTEAADVADAVGSMNQSYSFDGVADCHAWAAGSGAMDTVDECDEAGVSFNPAMPEAPGGEI